MEVYTGTHVRWGESIQPILCGKMLVDPRLVFELFEFWPRFGQALRS